LIKRDLVWDGCLNVRDLGGLPTEDGATTRFGSVVRADNVRKLSEDGWRALTEYGVTTIVDLRLADELAEDPPRELDLDVVLTGHGAPVTDHRALIDERLRRQDERAHALLDLLAHGPRSAHELAISLWRDVAVTQAFLTLSEVLGHLDLLIADGLVAEDESDDVVRFEAVSRG
jgi:hypothetical protein